MSKRNKKKENLFTNICICILILLISVMGLVPLIKDLNFGLDLAGGFEVLYKIDSLDGSKVTNEMVNSTYKIIEKRVNGLGVSEPEITIEGNNIRVQLAGVDNAEDARKNISKVGVLSFRDSSDNLLMTSDVLTSGGAQVSYNSKNNTYEVSLSIKDKDTFYEVTKQISESNSPYIAIWLDFEEGQDSYYKYDNEGNVTGTEKCGDLANSHCLSYASVHQGFASDVVIQGKFTKDEVTSLVELINSGSMPTKLTEISSRTVTASFGENSLNKTFIASIIGVSLIMLLLIILYRVSGVIASIGMMTYLFITLLIFHLCGGKLTLQGIAALVIGVGMAVDSAVISFSRIKEELRNKSTLRTAFERGNKQSFISILDANVTTLIAAIVLFIFGESSVKGFATMLIISIITTFVIMVYLSRYLIGLFVKTDKFNKHTNLFIGYKDNSKNIFDKVDFVKSRKPIYIAVCLIIVAGGIFIGYKGLNLGIDFKGGSTVTVVAKDDIKASSIKKDIKELGYKTSKIEQVNENTVYVTISDVLDNNDIESTENYFNKKYDATTSVGAVSNIVKKNLTINAIKALIYACIAIVIYISIRFRFSNAVSSISALIHDSVLVVILFAFLRLEVSSIFIAAILSIIGYSINNTIVIFDRIRENKEKLFKNKLNNIKQLEELVNVSLRQTITRCLITTITTLLPVVALIIFGSYEILNFNLALLFGLIVGTFSSLFIASQIWLDIEKRSIGKPKKKKWYEDDTKEIEELKVKGINC
ncbi:MAG: protein translocase subunit SecD [Bacilli bacterium]|nr:protein translocase subunit SecD [Bacilli bacterium]